jgi:hypothetical protein
MCSDTSVIDSCSIEKSLELAQPMLGKADQESVLVCNVNVTATLRPFELANSQRGRTIVHASQRCALDSENYMARRSC